MEDQKASQDEIYPKHPDKTYYLVEMMPGDGPMVDRGPDDSVFAWPVVLLWEAILFLGMSLLIFAFSLLKDAPLDAIANPQVTTDPAKAPWYFVGLQELLEHMHPTAAGIVIPTLLVLFLLAIPYLDVSRSGTGVWFSTSRGKRIVGLTAIYTLIVMPGYIALDNALAIRELLRDVVPVVVSQGAIPLGILFILTAIPCLILWRKRANTREYILALFTMVFVAAIVFTISGFLFRGPGFQLYWPWAMPDGYNPWAEF